MPSGRATHTAPIAVPAILIVALLALALLSGCGSGGSGETSDEAKAAPGVPLAKGGDNSIQTYGAEAPKADRARAATVLAAYLEARARGHWGEACSYLSGSVRAKLAGLAKYSKGRAKGCGGVMAAFSSHTSKADLRSATGVKALSLRVKGHRGFLIYRDGKGITSAMPLKQPGGTWKLASPTGIPLALGRS